MAQAPTTGNLRGDAGVLAIDKISPNEKLRRIRAVLDLTMEDCDRLADVPAGRTQSYLRKDARAKPTTEYLEALVTALKDQLPQLTTDWFTDGNDDWLVAAHLVPRPEVPLMGHLPAHIEEVGRPLSTLRSGVVFDLPPGAEYWRIAGDLYPPLQRGDLVLMVPARLPAEGALVIVRRGELLLIDKAGASNQPGSLRGVVVEVVRQLAGGVTHNIASAHGLTPEMISSTR
jgi:hypothetical protein